MSEKELEKLDTNADDITERENEETNENANEDTNEDTNEEAQSTNTSSNKRFVKARDKYSDMKSSALCLFIISIIGLIVTILDCFDMLPIKINANNSWIFYFAMYTLYGIFFVTGIFTLKSAKKVKSAISDEESQTDTIIAWAMDNLTSEYIDSECSKKRAELIKKEQFILDKLDEEEDSEEKDIKASFDKTEAFEDIPEELKCFDREDVISEAIKSHFDIDDDAYIASIIEEIYPEIFE